MSNNIVSINPSTFNVNLLTGGQVICTNCCTGQGGVRRLHDYGNFAWLIWRTMPRMVNLYLTSSENISYACEQGSTLVRKIDADGVSIGTKSVVSGIARTFDVAVDANGNYYVAHNRQESFPNWWNVTAYNSSGTKLWDNLGELGSNVGQGHCITVSKDGLHLYLGLDPISNQREVLKIDLSDGTTVWDYDAGTSAEIQDITTDVDGNVYFTSQFGVQKVSPDGIQQWSYVDWDNCFGISIDSDGNLYIGGQEVASNKTGVFKLNNAGIKQWATYSESSPVHIPEVRGTAISSRNEIQLITLSAPAASGDCTITYDGQTTNNDPALAWNATAAAINSDLDGLSNTNNGDIVADGSFIDNTRFVFKGSLGNVDNLIFNTTNLLDSGGLPITITVTELQRGDSKGRLYICGEWISSIWGSVNRIDPSNGDIIWSFTELDWSGGLDEDLFSISISPDGDIWIAGDRADCAVC